MTTHLGSLMELCYLKGSELDENDLGRKFKGRVVFLGDRVKDQYGATAVFEELASSPAGIEASKLCDGYGLLPGHKCEAADAEQAYTQADMKGTETWIRIPPHKRDPKWGNEMMVVKLEKALYGHPNAGVYWEQRCNSAIEEAGFVATSNCGEWRSCFFHPKHKVYLMVYVDDFKMAGPCAGVDECWRLIKAPLDEEGNRT